MTTFGNIRDFSRPIVVDYLEYEFVNAFRTSGLHVKIEDRDRNLHFTELPPAGIPNVTLAPPRILSRESVDALARALDALRLSVLPPFACGLDGHSSKLIIRAGFNQVSYQWWCRPEESWTVLDEVVQQILALTGCKYHEVPQEELRRRAEEYAAQARAELERQQREEPRRLRLLEQEKDKIRRQAIQLGLARPENVNQVLYEMPADLFREHFGESGFKRVDFKPHPDSPSRA